MKKLPVGSSEARRFRERRQAAGLSQEKCGALLGCTGRTVLEMEAGRREIPPPYLIALATLGLRQALARREALRQAYEDAVAEVNRIEAAMLEETRIEEDSACDLE